MLFSLTVGKVDAGVAVLLTEDKRLIEFPSILLPPDISSGSIVNVDVSRNFPAENRTAKAFQSLQSSILSTFGSQEPSAPVLRCRNATQTSIVLEWDPISLATSSLRSLSLFRNGNKAGSIPRPLEITSTKISGLAVDTEYKFSLVLKTSAGTFSSETLTVRTHKMTELHGITITAGILSQDEREDVESTIERIGGKLIEQVRIDTTHFVCTEGRGSAWEKASDMNIPIVLPEWLRACEQEGRLVGVRSYYLNNAETRTQSISGSIPQRDGGSRPTPDRRASQPASRASQPIPTTKITPPTPEIGTPSTPVASKATEDRDPPSPFTKIEETEEEKSAVLPVREPNGDSIVDGGASSVQSATEAPREGQSATTKTTEVDEEVSEDAAVVETTHDVDTTQSSDAPITTANAEAIEDSAETKAEWAAETSNSTDPVSTTEAAPADTMVEETSDQSTADVPPEASADPIEETSGTHEKFDEIKL